MSNPFLKPATDSVHKPSGNLKAEPVSTTELLIVEGKSAANAVDQIRDRRRQGIFMMQGKIPNPDTARLSRLQKHEQCASLMELLACGPASSNTTEYNHIVIVPDADVDGRHSAILLIALFRQHLNDWVTARRLHLFRSPLARIDLRKQSHDGDLIVEPADDAKMADGKAAQYLDTAEEVQQWLATRATGSQLTHYKGLAAINPPELANLLAYPVHSNHRSLCLTPAAKHPQMTD